MHHSVHEVKSSSSHGFLEYNNQWYSAWLQLICDMLQFPENNLYQKYCLRSAFKTYWMFHIAITSVYTDQSAFISAKKWVCWYLTSTPLVTFVQPLMPPDETWAHSVALDIHKYFFYRTRMWQPPCGCSKERRAQGTFLSCISCAGVIHTCSPHTHLKRQKEFSLTVFPELLLGKLRCTFPKCRLYQ